MSESEGQRRVSPGQPVFIMSEDAERTQGRDAQSANIEAGKAVAESVRTTLGPNGMDKMLVSEGGDVVVTNDGATILQEMDIEHPAAQMLVEVAESQEAEVGDGTTTAAVVAGELLVETEDLLDDDIHPTTIVEGFSRARDIALEAIDDAVLEGDLDDDRLAQVAVSAMTGKGTGGATAEALADSIVRAVRAVETDEGVDRDDVAVVARKGQSSTATELVDGIVADIDVARDDMPRRIEDAAVAVIDGDLDLRDADVDVEYAVETTDQLNAAVDAEARQYREMADAVVDAGADVAVVSGDVADQTAARLSKAGVLVFDNVSDDDLSSVLSATGASRVAAADELTDADLGHATSVRREPDAEDDELVFVEAGDGVVTLFVRGGTDHVVDELERAVGDGLDAVVAALDAGEVVPGAAAAEIQMAAAVRRAAAGIEGRQQLSVEAFADALDAIPRTLARNSGLDPIDALVDLRAANESGRAGVVGADKSAAVGDPVEHGILDPADVKREAILSATEAATMIARIDDVISVE
jgi:thermosome